LPEEAEVRLPPGEAKISVQTSKFQPEGRLERLFPAQDLGPKNTRLIGLLSPDLPLLAKLLPLLRIGRFQRVQLRKIFTQLCREPADVRDLLSIVPKTDSVFKSAGKPDPEVALQQETFPTFQVLGNYCLTIRGFWIPALWSVLATPA